MMKEEQTKEEPTISGDVHVFYRSSSSSGKRQHMDLRRNVMTNKIMHKSKGQRPSTDNSNLARGRVRSRGDEEIGEESIANDPTLVVVSSQSLGETRQALKTPTRQNELLHLRRRLSNDDEFCCGLVNTRGEKHCEEDLERRAVESDATRQGVEAALNEGMKTQMSIDDRHLFMCKVVDKNFEEGKHASRCVRDQDSHHRT